MNEMIELVFLIGAAGSAIAWLWTGKQNKYRILKIKNEKGETMYDVNVYMGFGWKYVGQADNMAGAREVVKSARIVEVEEVWSE